VSEKELLDSRIGERADRKKLVVGHLKFLLRADTVEKLGGSAIRSRQSHF
jgi:hypothetical protein